MLIVAAALAMVAANSPRPARAISHLLHCEDRPGRCARIGPMTVHLWINDAADGAVLPARRAGDQARAGRRRLASCGAAAPAGDRGGGRDGGAGAASISRSPAARPALARGWAIPAATDIAFAIGVMALLGRRVPASLKLFLTTVAIVDDMGAVAIIALAYTDMIDSLALAGAAARAGGDGGDQPARGERRCGRICARGACCGCWCCCRASTRRRRGGGGDDDSDHRIARRARRRDIAAAPARTCAHPWVAFVIVPLFGFANAGVSLAGLVARVLAEPLVLGIALGLFLGKQVGIFGSIWLAVRLGFAQRPGGASWAQIYGVALLAGIGFTMSLFIGGLAFPGDAALIDGSRSACWRDRSCRRWPAMRCCAAPPRSRDAQLLRSPPACPRAGARTAQWRLRRLCRDAGARRGDPGGASAGRSAERSRRGADPGGPRCRLYRVPQGRAARWAAAGRPGDAVGYVWPVVGRRAARGSTGSMR